METSPDAMLVASADGDVQFVNAAAVALFGRSDDELRREKLYFSLKEGECSDIDIWRGTERRFGEMRVVPLDFRGTEALLVSIRDNTERKLAEAQMAAADRLVSIGTMAASIAHEINNPIAAMLLNLEVASLTLATHPELEDLHELLAHTREAAERVRTIADDIRLYARPEEERPTATDVARVVQTTLRLARHETVRRARVVVEEEPNLPRAFGVESRLGQVLLNLVVNAAQSIPPGAVSTNSITVTTKLAAPDWIEIAVSDTGAGMSEQATANLFTPFYTSKKAGAGTGLGLWISKRIVDSYGGRIEVESERGRGTTFRVLVPVASDPLPSSIPPRPTLAPHRARVLIMDDDVSVSGALARALGLHHEVEVANSVGAAVGILLRDPEFDVILTDVSVPEASGIQLYLQLVRGFPETARKVAFLTGGTTDQRDADVLRRLPNRKLKKPLTIHALLSFIGEVVASTAQ